MIALFHARQQRPEPTAAPHSDEAARSHGGREEEKHDRRKKKKEQADYRWDWMEEGNADECVGEIERSRDATERQVSDPLERGVEVGGRVEPF